MPPIIYIIWNSCYFFFSFVSNNRTKWQKERGPSLMMNEFRPASYRSNGGGHDGRNLEIIEVKIPRTGGRLQGVARSRSLHGHNNPYYHNHKSSKIAKRNKKRSSAFTFSLPWNDADNKRRRRVAKYKYYSVEGKVKSSIKKGYSWFKSKCSKVIHGL